MTLFIVGFLLGAWTVGGPWFFNYLSDCVVEWEKGEVKAEEQPALFFTLKGFKYLTSSGDVVDRNITLVLVLMGPYGWLALFWGYIVEPLRDRVFKKNKRTPNVSS